MYIYIYYLQEDNEIELIIYEQGRIQDFFRGGPNFFSGGPSYLTVLKTAQSWKHLNRMLKKDLKKSNNTLK